MPVYIGLDIGGTKFLVASATASGEIIRRVQTHTPVNFSEGISLLHQMISAVSEGEVIASIGAAIGGPLDWEKGIVSPLHQPEWRNIPLKKIMTECWQCPFWVDVDTNIAALGEYFFGGEKSDYLLYLTLSTGMGGGYLIGGKIFRGAGGGHPEAGHISIPYRCKNPEAIHCECGVKDCLEALVSGNAIRRIYGKPAEELTDSEWEEVSYNLGQGLRNLAVLYYPEVIVLGGGVALGRGQKLIQSATKIMKDHLSLVQPPKIKLSNLGYDTALKGAIAAAIYGIH